MGDWTDLITGSARNWKENPHPMWVLWSVAFVMIAIATYLRRRKLQKLAAVTERTKEEVPAFEKQPIPDSPFFAYLGHNALTEAVAQNPSNTSTHAIDRIPEHIKLRNTIFSHHEEPQSYDSDPSTDLPTSGHWRSYSYPDTPHRQVSFDHVLTMRDEENDRNWQRRTLHICGI